MSSTNFWFDNNRSCQDPGQAIAWLQDARSRTYLSDYWAGFQIPRRIDLQGQALLMMGITDTLKPALVRDYNNGNGISAVHTAAAGSMKIWYVRRKTSSYLETKTVVIIADFNLYWQGANPANFGRTGWRDLYPNSYINAISLGTLATIVETASGVTAWW
jgi:hypothetical protein